MAINTIKGLTTSQITSISGVSSSSIGKINDIEFSTFTTDKLFIWYDAALESSGSTTFTNRVDNTLTGAIVQDGHGAAALGNASVQSVNSTQAMYLDGTNDGFWKRAYFAATDGSGEGSHGTSTFGVLSNDSTLTSDPSTQSLKNTGFTIEIWYRSDGVFVNEGQLWAFYSNNGIRTRFSSSGVRWFYTKGEGVMSSGWGTYSQNVWYHDVVTVGAPGADGSTSGKHTISLYVNNSLVQSLTSKDLSPMTYFRDLILWGGRDFSGSSVTENFRGYYGIVRVYHKALSSTEVTANYNAEKSRYGY